MNTHTTPGRIGRITKGIALLAACATVFSGSAWANPMGAQIVSGQVSMVTSGNQLLITNTPGAVVNWQNFSIGAGELTRFVQQGPNSSVLNRVIGQNPSQILGALQSNGKVFLINPNGIVFGAGARVDVNGLVASSLKLSNEDFAAGKNNFTGDVGNGAVHNEGVITTPSGGQVYLLAPNVTNSGLINSPGGDVLLAAGHSVQMADAANPALRVVVSASNDQALNVGNIVAQGGKIGIYGSLVRQRGIVNATSAVRGENGHIVFKASGNTTLEAGSVTRTSGGPVSINGDTVEIAGVVDTGGGALTVTQKKNVAQLQELPTLEQCLASPRMANCSLVLPTLASCTGNPAQAGCSFVLPSLTTCIAEPVLAGCAVVLPTLASCIATPSSVGCNVVLPTLNACTASPSLPGCTAVLPSITTCTATPTAAGCAAVLPTVSVCTTSPTLPGCSAVLPSLAICISNPAQPGCNVVLPSLNTCTAIPSQAGCSVILPSLATCSVTPSLPGCSVVLPTVNTCVTNPTAVGCNAVLPTLAACVSAPGMAGCSVVLPSLANCTSAPTLPGCSAVLPSLAVCTATPSAAGCAVILPPVDRCVADPSLAVCAVVSPTSNGSPVNQALNTTVNIVNTVTQNNVVKPPPAMPTASSATTDSSGGGSSGSGGGTTGSTSSDTKTAQKSEEKKDEKKDDKKELASTDKTGVKNDDAAKKLYCN